MKLNFNNFISFLNNNYIFENKPEIAVAVSGGPDSIALVHLLSLWIKKNKGQLHALLVDHKLREESYFENFAVKKYLESLNIKSHILRVSSKKIIKYNMKEARDNRFNLLLKFCKKYNILHLFLGHHFDDNLETFLARRVAGSNIEGLAAISKLSIRNKIQILRPLINFSKKDILIYNKNNNLKYINDPSNMNLKYTRAIIRKFINEYNYKISIKNDFNNISSKVNFYKKMVWEISINLITKINQKEIKVKYNDFIKLDSLIVEKIIQNFHMFFFPKKERIRSSKANKFISTFKAGRLDSFNLGGLIIKKSQNQVIFSSKINKTIEFF